MARANRRYPCRQCGVRLLHAPDGRQIYEHWCQHSHREAAPDGRVWTVPHRCAPFDQVPYRVVTPSGWVYQVGCLECAANRLKPVARRAIALDGRIG